AAGRSDGLRPQLRAGRPRSQGGLRHSKKCPISRVQPAVAGRTDNAAATRYLILSLEELYG
ncbi:MAG: hypothetical protein L0338_38830, partial [Acidobacteria bacterium]|nr:hypothetical protein [Acidobacteriota bacterium]